jgi:hypothetical protein
MSLRQQNPLKRFADSPPKLLGGIAASVDLLGDRRGVVTFKRSGTSQSLRAAGLSVPFPSGLERLLAEEPDIELVVVERAPAGLQRSAQERDIGLLDLAGRGLVVTDSFVYAVEPIGRPRGTTRNSSSPFSPKASRVVRALLSDPPRLWRLSDVAALADMNPGNVHRALAALVDLGFVERDQDAYAVADPGSLLEAWAEQTQPERERVRIPVDRDLRDFVRLLVARLGGALAVSGELAAEELAPYLPAEGALIHMADPSAFDELLLEHSKEPRPPLLAPGPGRPGEVLVDLTDAGVVTFASDVNGLPLASPQQVYVDLARDRGRSAEAAEHLRRTVLKF